MFSTYYRGNGVIVVILGTSDFMLPMRRFGIAVRKRCRRRDEIAGSAFDAIASPILRMPHMRARNLIRCHRRYLSHGVVYLP